MKQPVTFLLRFLLIILALGLQAYAQPITIYPQFIRAGAVTIASDPPGLQVLVDRAPASTPVTLDWGIGTTHTLGAVTPQNDTHRRSWVFDSWSDAGDATHAYTMTSAAAVTLAAKYVPGGPVSFFTNPAGLKLAIDGRDNWPGDASRTTPAITVTMDRARTIVARLARVASDGIDAIGNAAGETPETAVAPGSIISIYGPRLAPFAQAGPDSPLAQTLAGVTVTVGDQMLPLLFVSPGEINAQLPSGLTAGDQTLSVHSVGQPDITGVFTVARNAPGLFSQQVAGKSYLIALHEDGSLVTPTSPARRGELVTALGTGFGPYQAQPLDGFAVPNSNIYKLADQAELVFADKVIEPEFAGAAPGRVGVTAIRFRITDPLHAPSTVEIKARINQHESNTVLLPVE